MKLLSKILFSVFLLILLAACSTGGPLPTLARSLTPQAAGTNLPSTTTTQSAATGLASSCSLLNSYDIASLFSYAEVQPPIQHIYQVNHPIFTTQYAPAHETDCTFYAYNKPGSKDYQMLQVDYWIDLPTIETPLAWTLLSSNGLPKDTQTISGLGDGAFFANGQLTFLKNMTYITIAINGVNLQVDAGPGQALEIETQLARAILSHWGQ